MCKHCQDTHTQMRWTPTSKPKQDTTNNVQTKHNKVLCVMVSLYAYKTRHCRVCVVLSLYANNTPHISQTPNACPWHGKNNALTQYNAPRHSSRYHHRVELLPTLTIKAEHQLSALKHIHQLGEYSSPYLKYKCNAHL